MCVSCVIVSIVANNLDLLIGVVAAVLLLLDDGDDRDDDNDDTPGKEMYSLPTIPPPAMAEASNADSPPTLSYREPTLLDIRVVT
jgi:hypothetical protein